MVHFSNKVMEISDIRDKLVREKEQRLVNGEWNPGQSVLEEPKLPPEVSEQLNRLEQVSIDILF